MTVYGNTSRISVKTAGGGIAAIDIDTAEKVVIFARGDAVSGTVNANQPTKVSGPGELAGVFGDGQPINEYFKHVAGNGVSYDLMWGVVPEKTSVTNELVAGGSGGLSNYPIVEDPSMVDVQNTTAGQSETPVFKYGDPPGTGDLESDEVAINPYNGLVDSGDSDDYEIDYYHEDWSSAFSAATQVIGTGEVGTWFVGIDSETIMSDAIATATPLRENQWKMVKVTGVAQPNATFDDFQAQIDPGAYSDALDNHALFVAGPGRLAGSTLTIGGGFTGVAAGNAIDDPIIGEAISGVGAIRQQVSIPEQETLEDNQLIPISSEGAPTIEGNLSTSTATDWTRSFFARKLADRLILGARAIARAARGEKNNERIHGLVEELVGDEIDELIQQGVLEPNTDDENNWFVEAGADENNPRELEVSFGFTPTGVIDTVKFDATINY